MSLPLQRVAALCAAVLAGTPCPAQPAPESRTVIARMTHAGYLRTESGDYLVPEGTDQVLAEWVYEACPSEPGPHTYVRRALVHSVRFPRPGGLYRLTIRADGDVGAVETFKGRGQLCEARGRR